MSVRSPCLQTGNQESNLVLSRTRGTRNFRLSLKLTLKTPLPGQESGSRPRRPTPLQISQRSMLQPRSTVETEWACSSPFHLIADNPLPHPRPQDHLLENKTSLPSRLLVQTLQWLFDMTLSWTRCYRKVPRTKQWPVII